MLSTVKFIVFTLLVLSTVNAIAGPARVYEVIDLGDLGEGWYEGEAISESGYITGDYRLYDNGYDPSAVFIYHHDLGGMVNLNRYQGVNATYSHAIAESAIVGAFTFAGNDTGPVLSYGLASGWQNLRPYTDNGYGWTLGEPNGFSSDSRYASFNEGYLFDRFESEILHVSDYQNGINEENELESISLLQTPDPGWVIPDSVQMKGGHLVGDGIYLGEGAADGSEPYMWTAEHGFVRLGPSVGTDESEVQAVSTNGYVAITTVTYPEGYVPGPDIVPLVQVGTFDFEAPGPPGVSPIEGSFIGKVNPASGEITDTTDDYGEVFNFNAVNNWGHAVGNGIDDDFNTPATIFRDGVQQHAQDAISKRSPDWTVIDLNDINSKGQIVGTAINDDESGFKAVVLQLAAAPHQVQNDIREPADDRWGDDTLLGRSGWKISRYGCFITSTSMILNTFGHETDPEKLNEFLTPHMSDSPGYLTFGNIPKTVNSYGQTDGVEGLPVTFRQHTFSGNDKSSLEDEIRDLIWEHGPVLLRIPVDGIGDDNHAVVAYRVDQNGDILVRNPGSYESGLPIGNADRLTLDEYVTFESGNLAAAAGGLSSDLSWMNGMSATYGTVTTKDEMAGVMNSPVEFVITDPLGRRLGFDPTANGGLGLFYNEIPDSSYLRLGGVAAGDDPGAPGTSDGEHLPIDWYIGELIDGDYDFELFAIGQGDWTMTLGIADLEGFDPREFVFSGTTQDLNSGLNTFSIAYVAAVPEPSSAFLAFGVAISFCLCNQRNRLLPYKTKP